MTADHTNHDTGDRERGDRDTRAERPTKGHAPFARARRLVDTLRELLDEERGAVAAADSAALEPLAVRKRHLLDLLEGLQPALGEALERAPAHDTERIELLASLDECRRRNLENGVAVSSGIHRARSALALLRSTLSLDDLTLYDERGGLRTRRERRRLGRA